jgi:sortase (surface protein transpeptidase)
MDRLPSVVRTRLLPALLTAAGVALVTAGLLTYGDPTVAGIPPSAPPSVVIASPSPAASAVPSASAAPSASAVPSPSAATSPTAPADRVTTRVAVPALRIDLPVIRGTSEYPACNVAMYLVHDGVGQLAHPGQGETTYLYAHARRGMFLPLLEQSEVRNGAAMLGMIVQVWTSDEQLFLYEITEVRRHQTSLDDAVNANHEQLWLQTSEGPRGTVPKLQVVAEPLSSGPAPDPEDAHPEANPVNCE